MADVTLVDLGGQVWLVGGEEHLDALLVGALPEGVTVALVPCAGRAEMNALWRAHSPDAADGGQPWVLNPLITTRLLGRMGLRPGVLRFAPWSAALDAAATEAAAAAAAWLAANPDGRLVLRQFAPEPEVPGLSDLQRVRARLVAAALERAGADPARLRDEVLGASPAGDDAAGEGDALRIVMETGPSGA